MEFCDFQEKIQRNLAHRKKEIISLKQLVHLTEDEDSKASLRRAFLPLQYAHWEGFVKFLGLETLQYISKLGVKYVNLRPTFSAIAIYQELKASVPEDDRGRTKLLMRYVGGHFESKIENEVFNLSTCSEWVDTKSNLNKKALQELLVLFGIELNEAKKNVYIVNDWLDAFLGRRNKIAHGDFEKVTQDDFETSTERIVELLNSFGDVFLNYIERKNYLR